MSIDASGYFYVNAVGPVPKDDVPKRLQDIFEQKGQKIVFLKGDQDAAYGAIMDMMDALRKAQIDTVALITERHKGAPGTSKGGN